MNVILDTSTIQKEMSGTGYYSYGILRGLLQADSVHSVLALGGNQDLLGEIDNGKIEYYFPNEENWHQLLNFKLLGNRCNLKADIALFPNYFMPFGFSIPSLVTIHDVSFLSHPEFYRAKMKNYYRVRIKHTFAEADQILTVSEASKKEILKYSGRTPNKITVISPGPSLPSGNFKTQIPPFEHYFLWNGNIEERKNINPSIRAFLNAQLPYVHLVIVGKRHCGNRYWNEFQNLVSQSGNIHYLGYITNQELKQWYAEALGVVYCSFVEGFGIPLMNARSFQKPTLISDHPALTEAAGRKAAVVNPHNLHEMTTGFHKLFELAKTNGAVHKSNYNQAFEDHWNAFTRQLLNVIHKHIFEVENTHIFSIQESKLPLLKRSILKTLAYAAVFEAPVRLNECYKELHFTRCSYQDFKQAVRELEMDYPELVICKNGYLALKPYVESISNYEQAYKNNIRLLVDNQRLIKYMAKLPWISGVYFSGGTVHANHRENPDIDLFIVTKTNRVWLAYTLLKLFSRLTNNKELLCFNYVIDLQNLHMRSQQDLYTAHQLLYLRPANGDVSQPDLKSHNTWIYDFFPNSRVFNSDNGIHKLYLTKPSKASFFEGLNFVLMMIWAWIWKRKGVENRTGGTRWDTHQIKLHTHDHRPFVYKRFNQIQADLQDRIKKSDVQTADSEVNIPNMGCA